MKNGLLLLLLMSLSAIACAQCSTARQHDLTQPAHILSHTFLHHGSHDPTDYIEEDLCSTDSKWVLVFQDEFDGATLDPKVWTGAWPGVQQYNYSPPFSSPANYSVHGGSLFLTSTYDGNITPAKVASPGICTKRSYPAGKVVVRVKMQPKPPVNSSYASNLQTDVAPLWLRGTLDYHLANTSNTSNLQNFANEMDVEFLSKNSPSNTNYTTGEYTLHYGDHNIGNGTHYSDGASGINCLGDLTDDNWHIFEIEWNMYHVDWWVDGNLVNSLARTYQVVYASGTIPIIPIPLYAEEVDECTGPSQNVIGGKDRMFPSFANLPINITGLNVQNQVMPQELLPYTEEIDYVRYYRKVTCDKEVYLPPNDPNIPNPDGGYRSAGGVGWDGSGGDQVPPTITNQTPSVITGGSITVGQADGSVPYIFRRDDYLWNTEQYLDLMATEYVDLNPGFETDLAYQYAGSGESPWPALTGPYSQPSWLPFDYFGAEIVDCPMDKTNDALIKPAIQTPKTIIPISPNFNLTIYPNPATDVCHIVFNMPATATVQVELLDMTGRGVMEIKNSTYDAGQSKIDFSTADIAPGAYIVRYIDGNGNTANKSLVVSHGEK
jgi:hypothetical protein